MIIKHNNDHKFPNYNIQLAKTKEKTQKTFKLKMGMIQINLQVATFKKYEFELKNSRCKDTTSCWAHVAYFCVQTFKHYRIFMWHVLLIQVRIPKFLVSYFVEFVLNFQ